MYYSIHIFKYPLKKKHDDGMQYLIHSWYIIVMSRWFGFVVPCKQPYLLGCRCIGFDSFRFTNDMFQVHRSKLASQCMCSLSVPFPKFSWYILLFAFKLHKQNINVNQITHTTHAHAHYNIYLKTIKLAWGWWKVCRPAIHNRFYQFLSLVLPLTSTYRTYFTKIHS